jgi:hypothetical protein
MPDEWYLLGHDRMFSKLSNSSGDQMINIHRGKYGSNVGFKLPGQGSLITFSRQGSADSLSLVTMGKELFTIIVWVAIILAGVVMCGLSGYIRVVIVVSAALGLGVLNLFMPLLIEQLAATGEYAVYLVGVLWIGHWVFNKMPRVFKRVKLREKSGKKTKEGPEKTTAGVTAGSDADSGGVDEESQGHSVDVVNEARRSAKAARDKLAKKDKAGKKSKDTKKDNTDDKEGGR